MAADNLAVVQGGAQTIQIVIERAEPLHDWQIMALRMLYYQKEEELALTYYMTKQRKKFYASLKL